MDTIEDPRIRVARGAELLDEVSPGWHRRIAPRLLDLGSCHRCVLGQLWGDFDDGLDLFVDTSDVMRKWEFAGHHGFADIEGEFSDVYPVLTAAWRREVNARLAADAEATTPAELVTV